MYSTYPVYFRCIILRKRMLKLNDHINAINAAIPAKRRRFGSAEKTVKKIAKPQQPSATIAVMKRLCAVAALATYTGRLPADAFTLPSVVADAELVRVGVWFLRALAFGMTRTHLLLVTLRVFRSFLLL
jgi:hypothetical protein